MGHILEPTALAESIGAAQSTPRYWHTAVLGPTTKTKPLPLAPTESRLNVVPRKSSR